MNQTPFSSRDAMEQAHAQPTGQTRQRLAERVQMAIPKRARAILGTLILRLCNSGRKQCGSETCRLRPLCRCATEQLRMDAALEWKIWALPGTCGCVLIVYFFVLD